MPPQIFQPLYKRQETREDFQRELEFAFEDMYTGERSENCECVTHVTNRASTISKLFDGQIMIYFQVLKSED